MEKDPTPKSKISTLSHTARSFTRLASSSVQLVPQGAGIPVTHLFTLKGGLLRFAPANGFANAYRLTILALLRMFALYRNDEKDVTDLSSYRLNDLSTFNIPFAKNE